MLQLNHAVNLSDQSLSLDREATAFVSVTNEHAAEKLSSCKQITSTTFLSILFFFFASHFSPGNDDSFASKPFSIKVVKHVNTINTKSNLSTGCNWEQIYCLKNERNFGIRVASNKVDRSQ